jgi:hypothetical protein
VRLPSISRYGRALCLVALVAPAVADASRVRYLARGDRLCDPKEIACVAGTLRYHVNSRVLWLNGRLKTSPGPGTFAITIKGTTRQGFVRYAPLEIALRGRASEIVNFEMIPDDPDVENWEIERIEFVRDAED